MTQLQIRNFQRWIVVNGFRPWGIGQRMHEGMDFHVYSDVNEQPHFVRNSLLVRQIAPGILLHRRPNHLGPYGNVFTVLHSLPQDGEDALISAYVHIEEIDQEAKIGTPMPTMRTSQGGNYSPGKELLPWMQHLHFEIGTIPSHLLLELLETGKNPWGYQFATALDNLTTSEKSFGTASFSDPLEIFPLAEPIRYAKTIKGKIIMDNSDKPTNRFE